MNKNTLDPRTIEGKKYYRLAWEAFAFLPGPYILFMFCGVLLYENGNKTFGIVFITVFSLFFIAMLILLFAKRKCICIITQDRIYFFDCPCTADGKTKIEASGYVLLDAVDLICQFSRARRPFCDAVIHGADFKLTLNNVGGWFVVAVKRKYPSLNSGNHKDYFDKYKEYTSLDGYILSGFLKRADSHPSVSPGIFFVK